MGESLIKHPHRGVIVKGSNIVVPQFHFKEEKFDNDQIKEAAKSIEALPEDKKMDFRRYIKRCSEVKPFLNE